MTEYRYIKVTFGSTVDWRPLTDHLRCSPLFHGLERRDFVILNVDDESLVFAHLIFVFKSTVDIGHVKEHSMALVQKYDAMIPRHERGASDKLLSMIRVRACPRKQADFIFLASVIRGALLVDCYDDTHCDEQFVLDAIDTDMFIHVKDLYR